MKNINLASVPNNVHFKVSLDKIGRLELRAYINSKYNSEYILVLVPYSPVKYELEENLLKGAETLYYLVMYTLLFGYCPINLVANGEKIGWNKIIDRVESRMI